MESFKELQNEWYQRLADTGFVDIEDTRKSDAPLKAWHDHRFKRADDVQVETTRIYYERAKIILHHGEFKTPTYRRIWEFHCAGLSKRKITAELAKDPNVTHFQHVKVGYILQEIKLQMSDILIRQFVPEMDTALIYSSWPKGIYYGVRPRPVMNKNEWFADFFKFAQYILSHARIFVACMNEDPTTILGYSIVSGNAQDGILEFVYVKGALRRHGLGTLLTRNKGITRYRHATKSAKPFIDNNPQWKELIDATDDE